MTIMSVNRHIGIVVCISVVVVCASGCVFSREITHTRKTIERAFPGSQFDRKMVLSVGSFWLRTSSWLLDITGDDDAENVSNYLSDIDRIKIGIYRTESLPEASTSGTPMLRELVEHGWEPVVQARDDEGHIWVLYRSRGNQIRDAFVIVLSDEELVIARLDGHLDRLIQRAVRDHRSFRNLARNH